jgi:hypothetical protein
MQSLRILPFDCPRSCPKFERIDLCRFNPLFRLIGSPAAVNSHTVKIRIELSNPAALAAAVAALRGEFLGSGEFELFETAGRSRQRFSGFGFRLPGWRFPLIAQSSGDLAFDDFNGNWGNVADLDRLRSEYATAAAELAAARLGWQSERLSGGGLRVFHPSGGFLDVSAAGSGLDASGFNGIGCHNAAAELAAAIGRPLEFQAKPEFYQSNQAINVLDG